MKPRTRKTTNARAADASDTNHMNPDEIRKHFPNASRSLFAANSDNPQLPLVQERQGKEAGNPIAVRPKLERHAFDAALGEAEAKIRNTGRFLVRVTSIRRRLIDEDNLCAKAVIDCCRNAGLIPDDSPDKTSIEIRQRKAGKEEAETTLVEIYQLP